MFHKGSVATYARCGGILNIHLTANLPGNLPVNFFNRLIFDRSMVMSLWPRFLAHRVHIHLCAAGQADEEVEDKQTGNESLSVVLDDRILVAQRRNDRLRTSELEQIHTHSMS